MRIIHKKRGGKKDSKDLIPAVRSVQSERGLQVKMVGDRRKKNSGTNEKFQKARNPRRERGNLRT